MKEIEDTERRKALPLSWIGRISLIMPLLFEVIYIFNAISLETPLIFSTELENILKFTWKQISEVILSKKNKSGGITVLALLVTFVLL
jgi:hypothetical protein